MLKIYGADLSTPANKVRFVANDLTLNYEYIQVNLREGENKKSEFLKLHPAGKIPVINDDGFILFESNAIIRYFATKTQSSLYPNELKKRAIVDQWIDFVALHINTAMSRVVFNRLFAPFAKVEIDEHSEQDGLNFLARFLPLIDVQLETNTYLAGEKMSLADFALLATLDPAEAANISLANFSHILKWRKELKAKDFYRKCFNEYGENLKKWQAKSNE